MNISINATQFENLSENAKEAVAQKLRPIGRLLGDDEATALLEIELALSPAEGRSASPTRLAATLSFAGKVLHTEAVKPTPESAADRVRRTLEEEVRRVRGKNRSVFKRGHARMKELLRFGR